MKLTILILFLVVASIYAQDVTAPSAESSERAPVASEEFESPGRHPAKMFLPENLLKGPSHFVGPEAENDRLNNTYFLYSGDAAWAVVTTGALKTRINEIYAIQKLQEMKKGKEFAQGMEAAGEAKVKGVIGLVTNPLGTVENVPRGASRFFGRIGEGMKGGRTEGEGNLIQNISGEQKAKVALALKLGVSPYSYNQELQKELVANARAAAAGGLVVSAATSLAGGPAGTALTALNVNQTLQDTLVNSTPSDLRIINRKKLFALGVTRETADAILMHPWYSPWTETIMIDALANVGTDPSEFLTLAASARDEEDGIYFQRLAQVMAAYAQKKGAIRAINVHNGVVIASDAHGNMMLPLSCDYAIWSEVSAGRCQEFMTAMKDKPEVKEVSLWVDGRASEKAIAGARAIKIQVATEVLGKNG